MTTSDESSIRRLVIRVQCEGQVLYVEASNLREEAPALYRGFEQWDKDEHPVVPLEAILQAQADLRLCVMMPNQELSFCDLTQDVVTSDPFEIMANAELHSHEVWEYLPQQNTTQQIYPHSGTLEELLDIFDQTLYD